MISQNISLIYQDIYNQTVSAMNNVLESFDLLNELEYKDYFENNNVKSHDPNDLTFLKNMKSHIIKNGILSNISLILYGKPNTTVYLYFKSLMISDFSRQIQYPSTFEYNISNEYILLIPFQLGACVTGEITMPSQCYSCQPDSFSLNTQDLACKRCPSNAICHGGDQFELKSGFWRSALNSSYIISCGIYQDNCFGGDSLDL